MILGIDVGGTKIDCAIFDDTLNAVDRRQIATVTHSYPGFIEAVAGLVAWADARTSERLPLGIGLPGLVDARGYALSANVPCATGHRVASDLEQRLGRPVASANDTRCFALSESIGGAGAGFASVFGAILGTGAAGGLVIDGRLHRGRQGVAGEYGHLPLAATIAQTYAMPLWRCGCGLTNCVEPYIGGPGMTALHRHFGVDVATPAEAVRAWRAGSAAAQTAKACFLAILGSTFASVVKLYDPDVIVMGGGLAQIDEIIDELPDAIGAELFAGFSSPPVLRAHFGHGSGTRGAALLTMQGNP